MTKMSVRTVGKKRLRRSHEAQNLFSRLPATYAASRKQGQGILRRSAGLSILEWRTIWDLHEVGPLTIREIAEIQRADHSQLSRALPDMRKKGYVVMRKDDEDGRQTIVELTAVGRALYEQAAPSMKNRRETLRAQFTPEELELFVEFLDRYDEFLQRPAEEFVVNAAETENQ